MVQPDTSIHATVMANEHWWLSIAKSTTKIRSLDTPSIGLILAIDPIASGFHLMKVHGTMDRLPWTRFRKIIHKI
jgi:hypothetical protein